MNLNTYTTFFNNAHDAYEFLSLGPKGPIKKVIQYTEFQPGLYNLAFGDWDEHTQKIRDETRTNNEDRGKVLATVASTMIDFIKHHAGSIVLAQGSSQARTRLYQMGIRWNWHEISQLFEIKAFTGKEWEDFKEGKNYYAFAAKAR